MDLFDHPVFVVVGFALAIALLVGLGVGIGYYSENRERAYMAEHGYYWVPSMPGHWERKAPEKEAAP